jgi:formylglycine-generating enzyme required for sulfatase activity/dienelactone hydrolase
MSTTRRSEREIFDKAIEIDMPNERDAFIRCACGDDVELIERIRALLHAHDQVDFLPDHPGDERMTLPESTILEDPGTIIGRYKLLEKIGEGGMAVVYMAEQQKPISRKVALKIIKLGMDTKSVIARFEAERQALAMMDHPNIAKVLDAGATETGRPYFVMELVTGVSVTEYCDENNLSTKERLKLFITLCNAIQHAHRKGIIHRDIKPTNVMVTLHDGKPVPKVIDFGIAKAINQKLTEKTLFTRYAHMIGTPAYMSPEQAEISGLDVDTRTDIYSLGVLLYELLTGTTPFDTEELHKASLSEMQRIICEEQPTKPSTKLSTFKESLADIARHRNANPEILPRLIRGDLDWIVMKALEKDRTRRYETARTLAEDIQRHLRHEPILAGSPGALYYLQKFVRKHRPRIAVAALATVLFVVLILSMREYEQNRRVRWARYVAIPEIMKFIEQYDYLSALSLAREAERYISDDPALAELWPQICRDHSVVTTPSGADIFFKGYSAIDGRWQYLGKSPMENIRFPQGVYRWKIEKEGFEIREFVADKSLNTQLWEEGSLPPNMVWIEGGTFEVKSASSGQVKTFGAPAYLIDKYEVTNEQFKEFVNKGGYRNPKFWKKLQFLKEGRELLWAEAIREFIDKTGQSGPATWEGGNYSEGQSEHPVSGISWYEAAAYAEFVGKSLPTVYHWERAACFGESIVIVPFSNFSIEGTASVGSHPGMGHTGLYDMAGNVKEWCWNATDDSGSRRYILGGAWGEQTYMFTERDFQSLWDRSPANGFRCVQYPKGEELVAKALFDPLKQNLIRDFSTVMPLPDDEFQIYEELYEYDRTNLNAVVESVEDHSPIWRKEKITFDAAYGGESVTAYLFLPKAVEPPYQTVVYWPGDGATREESFHDLPERDYTEFVITNGRALLFPVYKGTYDRPVPLGLETSIASAARSPMAHRDWAIQMSKDLRRSVDYLETRKDIDEEKMAYYGFSWGAFWGPVMLALEDRFKAAVFVVGGFYVWGELPPAMDPAIFAPRVKTPILMVNGKEDFFFPVRTSQIPMYKLLGTADENKEHKLYPGGHGLFRLFSKQIRRDVLVWLDRYLGPVNLKQQIE